MMRVVIIDDEPLAASLVSEYLQDFEVEIVAVCNNGFEGVKCINDLKPDVVFLDVQMPKITGFEMLELLENTPHIIFTTAFEEHALKAFEANAIDYLLKPFSKSRFGEAMRKLNTGTKSPSKDYSQLLTSEKLSRLVLRDEGKIRIVPNHEIEFLEADDDYTVIYSEQGRFVKKSTLTKFQDQLPASDFVRAHRTYLVNIAHITRIEPYEKSSHVAILKSGKKVRVSKSGYARLKDALGIG